MRFFRGTIKMKKKMTFRACLILTIKFLSKIRFNSSN